MEKEKKAETFDEAWERNYELAAIYKEYYGNLKIKVSFITKDGITYDRDGFWLGRWLENQRLYYRNGTLLPARYLKLNALGINWYNRKLKDYERIEKLCLKHGISTYYNKNVLERITYYEFRAKLEYLLANNLKPAFNGVIHEIFYMCSENIQEQFGLSLEEVVITYFDHDNLRR